MFFKNCWYVGGWDHEVMDFNGGFNASGIITGSPEGRIESHVDLDSRNWSIFGQGEYDFTPQLTGIVGLRWSQDNKKIKFNQISFNMIVRIGSGRDAETRRAAGERIFEALCDFTDELYRERPLALSFELHGRRDCER